MKQVTVIVESKNKLVLTEDAAKGDYIDLADINSVDTSLVEKALEKGADKIYKEKLNKAKTEFELENQKKIFELQSQIDKIKTDAESNLINQQHRIENDFREQINKLENKLSTSEESKKLAVAEAIAKKDNEIAELKQRIVTTESQNQIKIEKVENEKKVELQKLSNELENANTRRK